MSPMSREPDVPPSAARHVRRLPRAGVAAARDLSSSPSLPSGKLTPWPLHLLTRTSSSRSHLPPTPARAMRKATDPAGRRATTPETKQLHPRLE